MADELLNRLKKFILNFFVAGISAAVAKTIAAPIERTKLILQNQDSALHVLTGKTPKYSGIVNTFVRITREQGFLSLYRGNGTNILRYFPMQALNFAFNAQFSTLFVNLIGTENVRKTFFIKFLSGGCAGACTVTILFPLEFCQTRIALDMGGGRSSGQKLNREFKGLSDCIIKVKSKDGYRGFYFGYPIAIVGISLYRALYFGIFDTTKKLWEIYKPESYSNITKIPIYVKMGLAQISTVTSSLAVYPMDTVARRMMLDAGRPKNLRLFSNPKDAFKTIYRKQGLPGFYNGAIANCFRSLSGALVLVFYDEIMLRTNLSKWITECDNC